MSALKDLRARHTAEARTLAVGMLERLDWDADRLNAHRTTQLRRLLRSAIDSSPWHRKRLAGLCPETVELDDLVDLPAMTKADLMANFDEIVTDPRIRFADVEAHLTAASGDYLLAEYTAVATGGSTGRRTVMLYDRPGFAATWVSFFRDLLRARTTRTELMDRQITIAWVSASHPTHVTAALARTFSDPGFRNVSAPITLPLGQIVQQLNDVNPDVLVGYASMLQLLAPQAHAGM